VAGEVVRINADGFLDLLEKLPAELVSKRGGPVLAGLRRGGNVMRKAWREEIDRLIAEPNIGKQYIASGTYQKSIRVVRMRRPERVGANEAVRVTVPGNATYPDGERVAMVAGVLEAGTEHMEAKAPMRKAFDARKGEVLQAVISGMDAGIQRAIKKLDKQRR
jgi:HK97 gp10 family phage protein